MPVPTAGEMLGIFSDACDAYEIANHVAQRDLKPITVLVVDRLCGVLERADDDRLLLCANEMDKDDNRAWVVSEALRHTSHYAFEVMVDVNVLRGDNEPYVAHLTAESEGYESHAAALANGHVAENDMLWDLYKLLACPSPFRLFVTRTSPLYGDVLWTHTKRIVAAYGAVLPRSPLYAVQVPTTQLSRSEVLVGRWSAEDWSSPAEAVRQRVR